MSCFLWFLEFYLLILVIFVLRKEKLYLINIKQYNNTIVKFSVLICILTIFCAFFIYFFV